MGKSKDVNEDIDVVFMRVCGRQEAENRIGGSNPPPSASVVFMRVFGFLGGRKTVKWEVGCDIVPQTLLLFIDAF